MKTKIYLRLAKTPTGKIKCCANSKPSYECLYVNKSYVSEEALPTLAFAVELEMPDELFKHAEQVAATINLAKEKAVICGKVVQA